jgi:hypothetical protein
MKYCETPSVWVAERDEGALSCPVELSMLLKSVFAKMDKELLNWLKGESPKIGFHL